MGEGLYSEIEISYPKAKDITQAGHFLRIGEHDFYLAEGELNSCSLMGEAELFGYLTWHRPEIPEVMEEEGITIKTLKKTLERAIQEEGRRKEIQK
jgi:hypothetical protein